MKDICQSKKTLVTILFKILVAIKILFQFFIPMHWKIVSDKWFFE